MSLDFFLGLAFVGVLCIGLGLVMYGIAREREREPRRIAQAHRVNRKRPFGHRVFGTFRPSDDAALREAAIARAVILNERHASYINRAGEVVSVER